MCKKRKYTKMGALYSIVNAQHRKNKDDKISKEFYYLGQGKIIDIKQETMANDVPVCEILYQLDQPVRRDIYDYIVNN